MTSAFQNGCRLMTVGLLSCASACTTPVTPAPTARVSSALETAAVGTVNADAADDPAIWAADPGKRAMLGGETVSGFVAGTDKKAGLYVYGLDGRQLQFLDEGLLNNVDLRDGVTVAGRPQVALAASDRGRMGVALYLFDPASADPANAVLPWGFIKSDVVEPYGVCLGHYDGDLFAVLIGKAGEARQYRIDIDGAEPRGVEVRRFALETQSEGCAIDDETGSLYVGEEAKGVWVYRFAPDAGDARTLLQGVDASGRLIADVEGVTLIRDSGNTYLLVSSQGDSAFAVWRVNGADASYAGRFSVAATGGVDAVSGTDGLDAHGGPIEGFPEGLVVVQDDENEGLSQNFKYIDWRSVRQALGL